MTLFEIHLFGALELFSHGTRTLLPATLKAQSLLAYLIMHRAQPVFREALAECFWPERPPTQALHSLSTALWQIRRILPAPEFLLAETQTVQFNPHSDFWLDVAAFHESLRAARTADSSAAETAHLQQAVALYRGDFLEPFYDDWCMEERYALEALYLEALGRLLSLMERAEQHAAALEIGQRLLARDALREDTQSAVIRLLVRLDRRSEALRQARRYRELLWTELGLGLQPETLSRWAAWLGPDWEHSPAESSAPALSRRRLSTPPLLERPPFVGRDDIWAQLLERWHATAAGRGHFVLLSGEAGIGKTRLCEELMAYVRQRGGQTAVAHCYEQERILPYGPLTDLLRTLIATGGAERLSRWQISELVRVLPELNEARGGSRAPQHPPATTSDPQQQTRLLEAINRFLLDIAQHAPLLLILEDLHWASESTLAWLHNLARRLASAPLLLVGSCRCEELTPLHPLPRLYTSLERAGLASRCDLERLSLEALSGWFTTASSEFVAQLHRQTEGNPFFAVETLRALHEAGMIKLTADDCRAPASLAPFLIPTSIQELLQARVARLPAAAREVAELAAVIGRVFDFETLQRAWGQDEERLLEALDALLRGRLIRESSASEADYEFDHHLIQEWLLTQLHYRRRRRWHRAIGMALMTQPRPSGRIAQHFEAAAEYPLALRFYRYAIDEARTQAAWQEANHYFERWLQLAESLDPGRRDLDIQQQRAEVLSLRAEHFFNLGNVAECEADVAALDQAAQSGDARIQLLACIEHMRLSNFRGSYADVLCRLEHSLALARSLDDVAGAYRVLLYAAFAHYFLGQPRAALARLEQAQSLCHPHEAACEQKRARLHQYLGYVHFHLGQWTQALQDQETALAHSLALEDFHCAAWNQLDAAYMHLRLGQLTEAQQALHAGLALAEQLQAPAAQGYALMLRGEIALHTGAVEAAETALCQALSLLGTVHSEHNIIATQELLGWVQYHQGKLESAQRWAENSIARARGIRHPRLLAANLIVYGMVGAEAAAYAQAQTALEEALLLARASECPENQAKALCSLARLLCRRQQPKRALDYAHEALTVIVDDPTGTLRMWAALEAGLAFLEANDRPAATRYLQQALALLPTAHAAWIRPAEVHAARARLAEAAAADM